MSDRSSYQPEIDGLRALAVLAVLFYHLDFGWAPGGFVGVDVFFVLSGYLITRLIAGEIESSGRFDFAAFYVRRFRRLFPALLSTVVVTTAGAFLLLSPEQMTRFSQSAAAAVLSVSNFLFWSESNYFDALATTKPLLHTWSLSVEEQFYLIWPVTLLILYRAFGRWGAAAALAVIGLASLALAQFWLKWDPAAAFYMLPARAMELGIGGLMVWIGLPRRQWLSSGLAATGLAAIVAATVLYTDGTAFPGIAALLPCLGTALFIAGSRSKVGTLFAFGPVVWMGKISYSLYLVHWPLIVLWKAYTYRPLQGVEPLVLAAISVLLAWAQYALVEQRFRRPQPRGQNRMPVTAFALAGLAVVAGSLVSTVNHGLDWRIPKERLILSATQQRATERRQYCINKNPSLDAKLVTCQNFRGMKDDIFIWGDSHAQHLAAGFSEVFPDYNVYVIFMSGCDAPSGFGGYVRRFGKEADAQACVARNKAALRFLTTAPAKNVVISNAKRATPAIISAAMKPIEEALAAAGDRVAFLGDFIRPGVSLLDCVMAPRYLVTDEQIRRRCIGKPTSAETELAYNEQLAALEPTLISPNELQCPSGQCRFFDDQGRLLYRDDHHLSNDGSRLFIGELAPKLPF